MITLRPYQERCVKAGLDFFKSKMTVKPKILVVRISVK